VDSIQNELSDFL